MRLVIKTEWILSQAVHWIIYSDPEIKESFDTKEAAIEALKKYSTDISTFSSPNGQVFAITEYYIEENEYDEAGDPITCNGV